MSYRNERFNRAMRSLDAMAASCDISKWPLVSDHGEGAARIRNFDEGENPSDPPKRPDCAACESCAQCHPCPLAQAMLLLILRGCGYVAPTLVAIATHRDREETICSLT